MKELGDAKKRNQDINQNTRLHNESHHQNTYKVRTGIKDSLKS